MTSKMRIPQDGKKKKKKSVTSAENSLTDKLNQDAPWRLKFLFLIYKHKKKFTNKSL